MEAANIAKRCSALSARRFAEGSKIARLLAAALTALLLAAYLTGCAAQSAAETSASRIVFEPAFGEGYDAAREAVADRADDAKLLAVTSTTFSQAHFPSSWTYLFYSWQRASAYTVVVEDGRAKVADNPGLALAQTDFDAVPSSASVTWDCDAAYDQVLKQLSGQGEYLTCRAYLMTYIPEDDDPTADAFAWFFSFNENQDLREVYLDPNAEIAPAATFSVDAQTGKVAQVR